VDYGYTGSENLYFVTKTGLGRCTEGCPSSTAAYTSTNRDDFECLTWLDEKLSTMSTADASTAFVNYIQGSCQTGGSYDFSLRCSCNLKRASKPVFRRCVFTDTTESIDDENPTSKDYLKMYMSDTITARNVIFGFGFAVALSFSFLFARLLSVGWIAQILVWVSVFGVLLLSLAVVVVMQNTLHTWNQEDPPEHTTNQKLALQAFGYLILGIAAVWACLMLWMGRSIMLAVRCVSLGSVALDDMPMLVIMPVCQVIGLVLFMVPWIFYCLYIASDGYYSIIRMDVDFGGEMQSVAVGRKWNVDHEDRVGMKLWFMFFCLLWTMNFISNFGSCVISHSVATWYFTYPENRKDVISNGTIWESYKLVLRKHFGTIALGSLLIGLVQFARSICLYIQKNLKKGAAPKRGSVKTGPMTTSRRVGQVVCCCISCCLCCFETFLKYISKQAYIQTAIHGYGFIGSGKASIALILKNILRVGGITFVSEFVLLIGKLFVTMLAAACSYIYISEYFTKDLYDPVAPTIMVAILAWMTATMFMDVLHMSVDTVLQCFIEDENANGEALFAPKSMRDLIDDLGGIKKRGSGTSTKSITISGRSSKTVLSEVSAKEEVIDEATAFSVAIDVAPETMSLSSGNFKKELFTTVSSGASDKEDVLLVDNVSTTSVVIEMAPEIVGLVDVGSKADSKKETVVEETVGSSIDVMVTPEMAGLVVSGSSKEEEEDDDEIDLGFVTLTRGGRR
jgi:hypothetical protein